MPTNKSAAVPFINHKGERTVKRVKVERYVAGKKPSYAKDDDEEYYTTDDEDDQSVDEELEEEEEEREELRDAFNAEAQPLGIPLSQIIDQDEDEDDDPRFRKLKQIESKTNNHELLEAQTKSEIKNRTSGMVTVFDEDEEEEEIRQRHALARARVLEEPIGPQIVKTEQGEGLTDQYNDTKKFVDLLEDFEPTLISSKKTSFDTHASDNCDNEEEEEVEDDLDEEERRREEEEDQMKAQIVKRIEEDNKRHKEREALRKFDPGTNDPSEVMTDDEDDELAYEAWKLREITRVLRDRAARALEMQKRRVRC